MRKSQTFASGAIAIFNHGNLEVRVPYEANGAATRSAALTFARSVWGPHATLLGPHEGHTTGRDVHDEPVSLRRFDVVIVGSAADVAAAMARFVKCDACDAPLERVAGVGLVDARSGDEGGTYDICPARYVEATDTQRGHIL